MIFSGLNVDESYLTRRSMMFYLEEFDYFEECDYFSLKLTEFLLERRFPSAKFVEVEGFDLSDPPATALECPLSRFTPFFD